MRRTNLWNSFRTVLQNLSYLVIGNILGTFISMIGLILITRYLDLRDFGIYSTVISYISLFLLFTLPQMNKVLIREGIRNQKKLNELLTQNFGLRFLLGWISIFLALLGLFLLNYDYRTKVLIVVFSISLLLNSINSYYLIIYQIYENMHYYAIIEFVNKFTYFLFTFIVIILDLGIYFLIIFSLITLFVSLVLNIKLSRKFVKLKIDLKPRFEWSILGPVIIFSLLNILSYLATQVDIFMISILRNAEDVGTYTIAVRMTEPGYILRNLVFISTFPMFIKLFKKGSNPEFRKMFVYSSIMGIFIIAGAVVLSFLSKPIILTFFPDNYSRSVPIFSVLVFFLALKFFELPFYNALQASNNEKKLLYIYWLPPFINIILNLLFLHWFGLIGIAYSTLIVGALSLLLLLVLCWMLIGKERVGK